MDEDQAPCTAASITSTLIATEDSRSTQELQEPSSPPSQSTVTSPEASVSPASNSQTLFLLGRGRLPSASFASLQRILYLPDCTRASTMPPFLMTTTPPPVWSPVSPLEVSLPYHLFAPPSESPTPSPFWSAAPDQPTFREYVLYINSIPRSRSYFYAVKKTISADDLDNKSQCTICLSDFALNEEVFGSRCNHYFHYECIHSWLVVTKNCPLCRNVITWEVYHLRIG